MNLYDLLAQAVREAPADTPAMAAVRRAVGPPFGGQWYMVVAHEAAHGRELLGAPPWPAEAIDEALMALRPAARVREELRAAMVGYRLAALCGMPGRPARAGIALVMVATRLNERLNGGRVEALAPLIAEVTAGVGPHAAEALALRPRVARQLRAFERRYDLDAAARRVASAAGAAP